MLLVKSLYYDEDTQYRQRMVKDTVFRLRILQKVMISNCICGRI